MSLAEMWPEWALDLSMPGEACFVPIEFTDDGRFTLVTGMNYSGEHPPGKLVAVVALDSDGNYVAQRVEETNG